ncbi:MAG: gliding motility-associated C-terminal domain-containing protein [Bacteroidota bacterium]|jgi:gliding motility-associated-like protein
MRIPRFILGLLVCATVWLLPLGSQATHLAGGNITYTKLANPNEYQITLTIYRDCNSIMQGPFTNPTMNMYYRNGCGQTYTLPVAWVPGTGIEVVTACTIDPSTCNGGTRYGLQEYKWTGTVTLPFSTTNPTCNDWYFVWGNSATAGWCCRNTNNTLGPAPGQQNFFIDSYLNNNIPNGNTSARFNSFQVPAYCIQEPVTVVFDVSETQGDSVVYSLTPARTGWNTNANYLAPRTAQVPANVVGNTININPNNGNLSFLSNVQQTAIFVLQVSEYRQGTLIGYVKVDVQVILGIGRYCDNIRPAFKNDSTIVQCTTDTTFKVELNSLIACNSIARDGSEFRLYDPNGDLVQIQSARPDTCISDGRTRNIWLRLTKGFEKNGTYYLVSRKGTDNNTFGNRCDLYMHEFDTLKIKVNGCPDYRAPLLLENVTLDTLNENAVILNWKIDPDNDTLQRSWFNGYNLYRYRPGENPMRFSNRFWIEPNVDTLTHRDVYAPVLPRDESLSYNLNLNLINGFTNLRSKTVSTIRLVNNPPTTDEDTTMQLQWNDYVGWDTARYNLEVLDLKRPEFGWVLRDSMLADTVWTLRKPLKRGSYKLRLYTERPDAVFRSYSNVLEFGVPFKEVVVPNVITPNGDDINDKVRIKYLYLYPGSAFTIFNRWGQTVYHSDDYQNDWDAPGLESGNYYYLLKVRDDDNIVSYSGTIRVIR